MFYIISYELNVFFCFVLIARFTAKKTNEGAGDGLVLTAVSVYMDTVEFVCMFGDAIFPLLPS